MMGSRLPPGPVIAVATAVLLCACATPQQRDDASAASELSFVEVRGQARSPVLGALDVKLDGTAPRPGSGNALLRSNVSVGERDRPVRYEASYAVAPGDAITKIGTNVTETPKGLGRHRVDQRMTLQTPSFGGAPVALGLSTEVERRWTTTGYAQTQRERAELRWSSSLAHFNLQWSDTATELEPATALDCNVQGSVRVPLTGDERSGRQSLSLLGHDCTIRAANSRYGSLAAQNWGVAYAWERPSQSSRIRVSKINPVWREGLDGAAIESSYELGVSHAIDSGDWKAKARVALRQAATWDDVERNGSQANERDSYWTTDTTLTRKLQYIAVSAIWVSGADPLWFTPERGDRRDHFGVELDFSDWARTWLPDLTPSMAMRWDWSHARLRDNSVSRDNRLAVNMAVHW